MKIFEWYISIWIALLLILGAGWYGMRTGHSLGYEMGRAETNLWWVQEKSAYHDAREILQKRIIRKHNNI